MLRGLSGRENHGLTAKGPYLGAAYGEHIAKPGQVLQGNVAGGAHKAIAQARSVHKQRQAVLPANGIDGREFGLGIQRAVFRGEGNIHHSGKHHMVVGAVGIIAFQISL